SAPAGVSLVRVVSAGDCSAGCVATRSLFAPDVTMEANIVERASPGLPADASRGGVGIPAPQDIAGCLSKRWAGPGPRQPFEVVLTGSEPAVQPCSGSCSSLFRSCALF